MLPEPLAQGATSSQASPLRIIGGRLRGRRIAYSGESRTRPMKDRVREAVFNLLGPSVEGKLVLDLFAGTGALGLEAMSRGAAKAIFYEQHFPTAAVIRQNFAALGLEADCQVIAANTFVQLRPGAISAPRELPWVVFCSPPYAFYVERQEQMLKLIETLFAEAPPGSSIVVEADERFDMAMLPEPDAWDVRSYPPAEIALLIDHRPAG
ncbi:MAG TPA: RsmD family RNA methyltransferase [Pirellulales bacterium]|jgi:16S rRNA (guanine966-N2)-methyltransferase|nr:RsmD family RNA methyltransferase [Pirellulales bacterium]